MICKNNHLFNRIYERFNSENLEEATLETIIEDWKNTKNKFDGIEKYFNTKNEHFNNNAYYWYLHLRNNELFADIELPFQILSEYFYFLDNYRIPITCIERLKNKMDDNDLTKEQRIFIYDKINGLIANADLDTQNNLAHINIEVLDSRWNLEPYQDLNPEQYLIEFIAEEASKIDDLYERLKYLKHRKLEYEKKAEGIGWDIGLGDEIQVEIEILEKIINDKNFTPKTNETIENLLTNVREHIKKGHTIEAINYLINNDSFDNESIKSDFCILSGQWKELERKVNLGLINDKEAGPTRNRISNAILNMINGFDK